jgi:hypothetical protein
MKNSLRTEAPTAGLIALANVLGRAFRMSVRSMQSPCIISASAHLMMQCIIIYSMHELCKN